MHQSFGFIFDGATHKHPNRRSWAPFRVYTTSMIIPFSIRIYFGHCLFFFFFLVETSCVILRPLSFRRRCGRHESHRVTQQTVLRHHQVGPGHLSRLSLVAMHEILWSIRQTHFVLLLLSQSLWLIQQKASKLWWPEYCFQLASVVFTICLSRDPFARASVDRRLAFLIFFWNKLGSMR